MRELIGRSTLSAIFVSLVCHRTKSDEELSAAFCQSASREWWRYKPDGPPRAKIGMNGLWLAPMTEEDLIEAIFKPRKPILPQQALE